MEVGAMHRCSFACIIIAFIIATAAFAQQEEKAAPREAEKLETEKKEEHTPKDAGGQACPPASLGVCSSFFSVSSFSASRGAAFSSCWAKAAVAIMNAIIIHANEHLCIAPTSIIEFRYPCEMGVSWSGEIKNTPEGAFLP